MNSFTIHTDCLQIVQTINDGGFSTTSASAVYTDCNILLAGFDNVLVKHCNRKANVVAHELARNYVAMSRTCVWDDDLPSFIFASLVNDITLLSNQESSP